MPIKVERVTGASREGVPYTNMSQGLLYVWSGNKSNNAPEYSSDVYVKFGESIVAFQRTCDGKELITNFTNTLKASTLRDLFVPAPKGTSIFITAQ